MTVKNRSLNNHAICRRTSLLVCVLIIFASLAVYLPVFQYDFINFDDTAYVSKNAYVKQGLTSTSIRWAFNLNNKDGTYWHPLTWISHMLDSQLFGMDPGWHHGINLIIHIASSLLLFIFLKQTTGSVWPSAFVATVFAVHPLNVDSVAWIAERKNVLSTLFWMLTLCAYAGYVRKVSPARYILLCMVFIIGLMAKPMLVTLPFVLILLDYWPLERFRFLGSRDHDSQDGLSNPPRLSSRMAGRILFEKMPLIALSLTTTAIAIQSLEPSGSMVSTGTVPMILRVANAFVSYVQYILKMIWPFGLSVYYPFPDGVPFWPVVGSGLVLVGVTVWSITLFHKKPYIFVGWLWYVGTMFPVIGIVQAGNWPAIADRWAYVPLIGLYVVLAWLVSDSTVALRYGGVVRGIMSVVILGFLMVVSHFQVKHWENDITLYKHALEVDPDNYLAHNNLGAALEELGRKEEAAFHYMAALSRKPDYIQALNNMGNIRASENRLHEARQYYLKSLNAQPGNAATYMGLGRLSAREGDIKSAVANFSRAVAINPADADGFYNLGVALSTQNEFTQAVTRFEEAILINPDHLEAHNNLANLLVRMGRIPEAVDHYLEVLRIRPGDAAASENLKRLKESLDGGANIDPHHDKP